MNPQLPDNCKVAYGYIRDDPTESLEVHPRVSADGSKGTTIAVIFAADDEFKLSPLAVGVASCGPNDQFSRRIGRTAALGRAIKQLQGYGSAAETDEEAALEHISHPQPPDEDPGAPGEAQEARDREQDVAGEGHVTMGGGGVPAT